MIWTQFLILKLINGKHMLKEKTQISLGTTIWEKIEKSKFVMKSLIFSWMCTYYNERHKTPQYKHT